MIINSTGVEESSLDDYLGFWTEQLQKVYGSDFVIRKEGVIDNLATAGSTTCILLEDVIAYLVKQMNPYTAEGEFQDALYALVGLTRNYASYTVATRTIQGTAGTVCDAGTVRIQNSATGDIFELNTGVTVGDDGTVVGSFTAIELGGIELDDSANLEIVDAPEGIKGVYFTTGNATTVGDDYEDDSEFRARWIATNSAQAASNTQGGLRTALLELVNNVSNNLSIRQNRNRVTYDDLPLHTMAIVIKSGESDETIAQTIFNNLTDGVGLEGSTIVTLQDDEGTDVDISFTRATEVPIYFKVVVALKENVFLSQVERGIQNNIVGNFDYAMSEKIVANEFYSYVNEVEGVDYVDSIEISTDNETWAKVINMDYNEYGSVIADHVTVSSIEE